jgi:nucleotide-binding universal stress UspA family protein
VLALDVPEHALTALPIARRFGELFGGPLRIVHGAKESLAAGEVLQRLGLDASQIGRAVLECRGGEPADAITDAARTSDAAVIVMCTHTGALAEDEIVDGAALAVLQRAPCPVVLIHPERGERAWALRRVLVPHDGTPTTTAALPVIVRLARSAAAELSVLQVAAPRSPAPTETGSFTPHLYIDQPQHEWPAWESEFLERLGWSDQKDPTAPRIFLMPGAAGEQVLRFAKEHAIDLIVLAWRGCWEEGRAPVAKEVLRYATCPVMVIRTGGG